MSISVIEPVTRDKLIVDMRLVLDSFKVKVVWIHLTVLLIVLLLPMGDSAFKLILLRKNSITHSEIILLIYMYYIIIAYGLLYIFISAYKRVDRSRTVIIGLACLLLSACCINALYFIDQKLTLLAFSTLYHMFFHLGNDLLRISVYSILINFVPAELECTSLAVLSLLCSLASDLAFLVEKSEFWLFDVHPSSRHENIILVIFVYYVVASILGISYCFFVDSDVNRQIEQTLILFKYRQVRNETPNITQSELNEHVWDEEEEVSQDSSSFIRNF